MLLNSKRHIDRRGMEVNMIKFTVQNTQRLPKHKSTFFIIKQMYVMHFLSFYFIKTIDVTDGSCEIT